MSSVIVKNEITLVINSDPASGAKGLTSDGSSFSISLDDGGIQIPKLALNTTVAVETATIWWSIPNITEGVNNKMYIKGDNTSGVLTDFVVVIPTGLYDLTLLNASVLTQLENQQAKITPTPLLSIGSDEATATVSLKFNYVNVEVDFRPADTFRDILGFNARNVTVSSAPFSTPGDTTAGFNTVNSFLIHSDLVSDGLRYNNTFNQTIAQVLIDVAPQEQINSQPFNPAKSHADTLRGINRNNIKFWLTDENNKLVNTNGEYWGARIVIRYDTILALTN